VKLKLMYFNYF